VEKPKHGGTQQDTDENISHFRLNQFRRLNAKYERRQKKNATIKTGGDHQKH